MDQILATILWYLLLAGFGWLVFPIAYRFLGALPDKGYAFLRPLGLLLWGFVFWFLSSLGFLRNDPAGLLTAAALLAAFSWWAWRQVPRGELRAWLRANKGTVIAVELLFLLAFAFMTFIRISRPEIYHTEQPMELAFISAIMRSPAMPPHDPWLSGYSISYYYFGYLMVAMLAKLTGVISSVAFNLGFITIFASAAVAAYGLAFNLLALYKPQAKRAMLWLAGLAPLLVLIMGNVEGLLEIAHARHLFWDTSSGGLPTSSSFWTWLDIDDLSQPPSGEPSWAPRAYGTTYWWWWRASRVINDHTFTGGDQELIDEFPAFSFTLGDLHPHVLSMPFVMLAMGLALNLYLGGGNRHDDKHILGIRIREDTLMFSVVLLGSLGFLNIWDLPIYVGLAALAFTLGIAQQEGWSWKRAGEFFTLLLMLGTAGILLYQPFYLGFTSQAGGILPNLINPSRGVHLWVMFGLLLIPMFIYLFSRWQRERAWRQLPFYLLLAFAFIAALWAFSLLIASIYAFVIPGSGLGTVVNTLGAPDLGSLFAESLSRRIAAISGIITLGVLLALASGTLALPEVKEQQQVDPGKVQARFFVALLIFVGTLLVIAPEFIYLADQFGTRMNTVFKFFFQAWQMWAVATTVIVVILLNELRGPGRAAFAFVMAGLLGIGLIYPSFSFSNVTMAPPPIYSLDGASHLSADSVQAIQWLRQAPLGTLVEAVGGSYDSNYARYAAHSGQEGVMGWPGHEGQWRGGNVDWVRIQDIETLYTTPSWSTALAVIERYGIDYVILGEVERGTYVVDEAKFAANMVPVLQNATVTIYQLP
jgi:YYY domain-containing protein